MLFTKMLVLVIFASDKHFGLVGTGCGGLKGNTQVHRDGEVLSTVILTTHGTCFHDLNTVKEFPVCHGIQRFITVFMTVCIWAQF
jgi:hypothetical protein